MKLLALIEGPDHVCYRYRIKAFEPALAEHGWTLEAIPLTKRSLPRIAQLRRAAAADVVVLQRKLLPLWQLRILRKAAKALIYDFDDALFHRDSYHPKGLRSWRRLARFWAAIYAADAVTAGNEFLQGQATAYVPAERVHCFPTCIAPGRYRAARHGRQGGEAKLVWIGQRSTLPSLHQAEVGLAAAAELLPGLELRVVSDVFPNLSGIRVAGRPWSAATEAEELADADIGVSWLPDDAWSRGKCGLKVLQFMAAGLPVVANPVGVHCQMVVHGETGFLARTPQEWAQAISQLAADAELRTRLGTAGRRLAEERYGVNRWAARMIGLLNRLVCPAAAAARRRSARSSEMAEAAH
ncbi:MAG TPA: glycosyltransferase family 4 protein [Pirellulales bacterium]|nr:glycosyltransferase family 4 protein [Pirellulales bacterium]